MPFFLFSSVKMKRGEKLSLLLCDRWKEEKYYLKYYGVALLFFLRSSSNRGLFYVSDSRLEIVRQKTSSLYFVERFLHAACYEL